jgi:hypothetical protein
MMDEMYSLKKLLAALLLFVLVPVPRCRGYAVIPASQRGPAGAPRFDDFCDRFRVQPGCKI